MLAPMRALAIGIVAWVLAGSASADRVASLDDLGRGLPKGWKFTRTAHEITIERTQPVRVGGWHRLGSASHGNQYVLPDVDAEEVTLRVHYRIVPAWDAKRYAAVGRHNAQVAEQVRLAHDKYKIAEIPRPHGYYAPRTDAERTRLAEYQSLAAKHYATMVALPSCEIGAYSLFDVGDTKEQLRMMVQPTTAMRELYAVVELVKRRCR
jgi:hypothetical protein